MTRSTFAAEVLSAGDATDQGIVLSQLLYEVEHGVLTAEQARNRRTQGGFVSTSLYVDAKSVFAAITATILKTPTEKSLLCHVQYLRELLGKQIIHFLVWLDTRDMGADGLTKGTVAREHLQLYMEGKMHIQHEYATWHSKAMQCKRSVEHAARTMLSFIVNACVGVLSNSDLWGAAAELSPPAQRLSRQSSYCSCIALTTTAACATPDLTAKTMPGPGGPSGEDIRRPEWDVPDWADQIILTPYAPSVLQEGPSDADTGTGG